MSLACEISGEPLLDKTDNEVVVTPSGHICIKRLLLTKLLETGGMDPFETSRPLSEDQLVTLQLGNSNGSASSLPRPQATALPNMLGLIQKEYDALVLELFDTRKALEETRRELSQALYQNDAAIRVVARISQERDTLQQQLEQWSASASAAPAATAPATTSESAAEEAPSAKRRKLSDQVLENDLPEEDVASMSEKWAALNKVRKPTLKAAAAEAPSAETLGSTVFLETKAWHKSTNRGISCIASDGALTVTAGKDKQVVVYDEESKVVQQTFALGAVASCVSIGSGLVVAGTAKGAITLYTLSDGDAKGSTIDVGSGVVDVCVHPTGQHVCAATQDGRVVVAVAQDSELTQIASFSDKSNDNYTAAALHPDGLIYVAGTKTGNLHIWDFKNKTLATTLQVSFFGRYVHSWKGCIDLCKTLDFFCS